MVGDIIFGRFPDLPEEKSSSCQEIPDNLVTGVFNHNTYRKNIEPKTSSTIDKYVDEYDYLKYISQDNLLKYQENVAKIKMLNQMAWDKMYGLISSINLGNFGKQHPSINVEKEQYESLKSIVYNLDLIYIEMKSMIPQNIMVNFKRDHLYEVLYFSYQRIVQEAIKKGLEK